MHLLCLNLSYYMLHQSLLSEPSWHAGAVQQHSNQARKMSSACHHSRHSVQSLLLRVLQCTSTTLPNPTIIQTKQAPANRNEAAGAAKLLTLHHAGAVATSSLQKHCAAGRLQMEVTAVLTFMRVGKFFPATPTSPCPVFTHASNAPFPVPPCPPHSVGLFAATATSTCNMQ